MQRTNSGIIRMKHVGSHRRELPNLRGKLRRKGDVQMRQEGGKMMKGNTWMRRGNGPIRQRWSCESCEKGSRLRGKHDGFHTCMYLCLALLIWHSHPPLFIFICHQVHKIVSSTMLHCDANILKYLYLVRTTNHIMITYLTLLLVWDAHW